MKSNESETGKSAEIEKAKKTTTRKKYCDRNFKQQLAKAIKANGGEPEYFDKIRSNKLLAKYDSKKLTEYTNQVAKDVQKNVDRSTQDPRCKEIVQLTKILNDISGGEKPQDLPLLLKLNAASLAQSSLKSNEVNFGALNKFLYSAVSGLPDHIELNDATKSLLFSTYASLMEQVESDAPAILDQLKSPANSKADGDINLEENAVSGIFQDGSLNPFNVPLELLLKEKPPE